MLLFPAARFVGIENAAAPPGRAFFA